MGLQLFFYISAVMVRFSNGFQEQDDDTLLIAVTMSNKAQIYFSFSSL